MTRKRQPGAAGESSPAGPAPELAGGKTKFVLRGLEATDKKVAVSHSCGRVYLPLSWLGKRVKIIRLD